ncbi:HAMP domain-containing protein [Ramlibacter sp. RBP-2]|uniref:histidine kinase n=2 Tax=Ramlibacter lithotrophicus TaxID=2606681 RepID=A0A7X6I5V5_9BURK|nr:ATP-binding protein [Ramlibacter lithotrophicus]NKE65741.1 HAMP domain-containing protein [Ramlibacter lithotrophicus]
MLVLGSGLLLAQLLSAAINLAERDRLLLAAGGMRQAQRIADVVKLLDPLGSAERERIVAVLNVPPLVVVLADAPAPSRAADDATPRAASFAAMLLASLGEPREIRVEPAAGFERPWPPGAGHRHMMGAGPGGLPRGMGPPGPILRAQVQLRDGRWARFESELPSSSSTLPWRLALTLAVLLVAVLVLSYVAVRWVTRPLHVLAGAAEALGRDIHRPPLAEEGPLEIRQAARAFNTMQGRLVRFIEDRTRIFAAMSHDLKTPITRMRLRADLLDDDELRHRFESDLKEMEAMVTHTLEFMRGMGGQEARQDVDVMALLESLQSDNEAMGRSVTVQGQAAAPYPARVSLLKRCLGNLIDNAVLYGERATVQVEDSSPSLTLRVLDEGPGIPPSELEKVFEPFYRLEQSRSRETGGTGLGLAIARNIAHMHGGDIVLRNRPVKGLEAVLTLPRPS